MSLKSSSKSGLLMKNSRCFLYLPENVGLVVFLPSSDMISRAHDRFFDACCQQRGIKTEGDESSPQISNILAMSKTRC